MISKQESEKCKNRNEIKKNMVYRYKTKKGIIRMFTDNLKMDQERFPRITKIKVVKQSL